jgi:hypothetical protein
LLFGDSSSGGGGSGFVECAKKHRQFLNRTREV